VDEWEKLVVEYRAALENRSEISRRELRDLKKSVREAASQLRESLREWMRAHQTALEPSL
jgi:hypothetical protein